MTETAPRTATVHHDDRLALIKKIANNLMMGIFSVMFVVAFGSFFFWGASLTNRIIFVVTAISAAMIIGLIAQTAASVAPLALELWQKRAEIERDEPLFP